MSRYRLFPTRDQESQLLVHCAHARFVWNLACEQHAHWRPGRGPAPGYTAQARQLTAARAACGWLAAGSQTVQQQALRDFAQAMTNFFAGTHGRPTWRKAGVHEGFRQVGLKPRHVRKLSRRWAQVLVPKLGWVRFRLSRPVPAGVKSYRVTRDRAGRWHLAFAHRPDPIAAPGNGLVAGVDRGVAASAAICTGELLRVPGLRPGERRRLDVLQRKLSRARRGSTRRAKVKAAIARLMMSARDRRRDWAEQTSTALARAFEVIGVEALDIGAMTRSARGTPAQPGRHVAQKAGLNRAILASAWGLLVARLEDKAPGRVVRVRAAGTSQTCAACRRVDADSRKSQAEFVCTGCGHAAHADVNAAVEIARRALDSLTGRAAGRAVPARGGLRVAGPANREPHLVLLSA